jgi:creatinine amidohydrolase
VGRAARLDELSWTEVADRAPTSVLAVPVGSTEQHGPHLPLSTDTDIAGALCAAVAAARDDILIGPALAYGAAGEHAGFPGTLSLGATVTESALIELGRSADAFAGLLLVSTHGGNAGAVGQAVSRLVYEGRRVRSWTPSPIDGDDAHAGRTETSLMLALRPEAVRVAAAVAGATAPIRDLMPALRRGGVVAVSANGILGDPADASADEGRATLERWTGSLLASLRGWPA